MTVKAHEVLEAGVKHMQDRAATYDKPDGERSMEATVNAFNVITGDGLMNTEERGWLFMNILKMVRSQQGEFKLDNYEDGAAYWGLAAEAAHKERVTVDWPTEDRIENIGQNGNDGAVYESQCWCEKCNIRTFTLPGTSQAIEVRTMMALCPQCGDKRCERAKHHDSECSAKKQYRDLEKPWEWQRGDIVKLYEDVATTYVELDSVLPDLGLLYWVDKKDVMKACKIPEYIKNVQSVEARN